MNYSVIEKETFKTICVAYPDEKGVETEDGLNSYEAKSQGCVEVFFVKSKKEATNLLKNF